ncbi:periplasmic nitrate reductase, NapE protein [Minwuia thermotolerans]|uniref:Periplasmic nitrate reductase, NapE protein n=1 Tax=Minwuia thermotolerans TaxID=2056226 RepID=A0A2M9FYM0_9PROT|nr:periplasmic nitrate reductase, NapE protein [Minwuia thermotolerans]PJK28552.1 periplasmic nitrate reductase, NapE protein [Minwuia thermotolerans]
MSDNNTAVDDEFARPADRRRAEIRTFLFTTFVVIPALAVAFVGAYGFIVWISQMIFGPPGPPPG